jgi:cytochrome c oxidase subunit 2
MKKWFYYAAIMLAFISIMTVLISCGSTDNVEPPGGEFSSNGQRIYFTATSSSGEPIIPEGFTMMMHHIACVDCHGPQGKGGTVYMMMERFDVPNITWPDLTGQHEDHPPYTEETVKQAITMGVDPAGNELEKFMPLWQISAQDLNDLVTFMKTLE